MVTLFEKNPAKVGWGFMFFDFSYDFVHLQHTGFAKMRKKSLLRSRRIGSQNQPSKINGDVK